MTDYVADNYNYTYILTSMDCSTKFAWAFACRSKSAPEIYFHLERPFLNSIVPKKLHTDNGREFRNNLISNICKKFNIRLVFDALYHPES